MNIAVEKVEVEGGWTVRISTPPLLNYILVNKIDGKTTITMPNCKVTIDGVKTVICALQKALEEAEALQTQ